MLNTTVSLTKNLSSLSPSCSLPLRRASSHSSSQWVERQNRDIYVRKARYDNYRARSAYKLIQLDDKFKFLRPGHFVVECGAAPGAWTQVICERLELKKDDENLPLKERKSTCLAIDLRDFEGVDGAICLGNVDFCSPFTQAKLLNWLDGQRIDCLLSDMAPTATGIKSYDHETIINLNKRLLRFGRQVLKGGSGVIVCKIWDGAFANELKDELRTCFQYVKTHKPQASRSDSSESYIIARDFRLSACQPLK
ncbi:rRNA methyltransferase 2, mitochondrial, partial [Fragariocoptes setiger]